MLFFNIFPVLFKSKALYTKRFFCSCTCQRSQRTNYQVWNQPHNTPAVRQPHDTLIHSHPLGNAFKYAKGYTYPSLRTTPLHVIWSTACICEYALWVTYTVVLHHTFCSKSPKALCGDDTVEAVWRNQKGVTHPTGMFWLTATLRISVDPPLVMNADITQLHVLDTDAYLSVFYLTDRPPGWFLSDSDSFSPNLF